MISSSNLQNKLQHGLSIALLSVGVLLIFHYCYHLRVLNPLNYLSMFWGDPVHHYIGWEYFRISPWGFPLGETSLYWYPLGTNIGYTDSIPLLSIPLKLLSPILPEDFQFLGPWLGMCFLLQGIYAWPILKRLGWEDSWSKALGTFLFCISPVLIFRASHVALCGHWLLLASMYLFMDSDREKSLWYFLRYQGILMFIGAWLHPYLGAMVLGMTLALGLKWWVYDQRLAWWGFLLSTGGAALLVLGSWYVIGYFSLDTQSTTSQGFGYYSMNLNTFFNHQGMGAVLPKLGFVHWQYEGFAYLGLGIMLLILVGITRSGWQKRKAGQPMLAVDFWKKWWPMLLVALAMMIFALSAWIHWGEEVLFRIRLSRRSLKVAETFRSSGRFVWPMFYLILVGSCYLATRLPGRKWWLLGVLALQLFDLQGLFDRMHHDYWRNPAWYVDEPSWMSVMEHVDEIQMVPGYQINYAHSIEDYAAFSLMAKRYGLPINTGFVARTNDLKRLQERERQLKAIQDGALEPNMLYIGTPEFLGYFDQARADSSVSWFHRDGYIAFLSKESRPEALQAFADLDAPRDLDRWQSVEGFMESYQDQLVLITAFKEASFNLALPTRLAFRSWGSGLDTLRYRGSYISLWASGKLMHEAANNYGSVAKSWAPGDSLGYWVLQDSLHLSSGGAAGALPASIRLGETEYALRKRGLNIAVLDSSFQLIEQAQFDTYKGSVRVVK